MVAAAAAIFVIWLIGGCGASGSGTSPFSGSSAPIGPTTPASTPASTPAGSDTISGAAKTAVGSPVASVAVGFQLTTASCSSCDIYETVTDSTGRYTLHLPVGTYQAQCVATGGLTCLIASSPPEAAVRVNVVSNGTVNLLVATPAPPTSPSPAPPTMPSPTPPPNPPSGDVVSGHVLTSSGQPVPNAAITFRMGGCPDCEPQPHIETGSDGSYSITLQPGVYNAECDVIGTCGAQGTSGGGVPVNVPPGGTLNFIVCPSDTQFPQCAQQ